MQRDLQPKLCEQKLQCWKIRKAEGETVVIIRISCFIQMASARSTAFCYKPSRFLPIQPERKFMQKLMEVLIDLINVIK